MKLKHHQLNALRKKLAELQNSRRNEEKEEEEKQTEEKATEEKTQKVEVDKWSPTSRLNAAIGYKHRRHSAAAATEKRSPWGKRSSDATVAPLSTRSPDMQNGWTEPRTGWCKDVLTLQRRQKELQKMKCRPTYKRYLSTLPKYARKKGVDPCTPNKWINHSRRSWDKQVRLWKLAIYEWAGKTPLTGTFWAKALLEAQAPLVVETPLADEAPSAVETPTSNGNDSRCKKKQTLRQKRKRQMMKKNAVKKMEETPTGSETAKMTDGIPS